MHFFGYGVENVDYAIVITFQRERINFRHYVANADDTFAVERDIGMLVKNVYVLVRIAEKLAPTRVRLVRGLFGEFFNLLATTVNLPLVKLFLPLYISRICVLLCIRKEVLYR